MGDMTEYYSEGIEFGEDVNGLPLCDKCRRYHESNEPCEEDDAPSQIDSEYEEERIRRSMKEPVRRIPVKK